MRMIKETKIFIKKLLEPSKMKTLSCGKIIFTQQFESFQKTRANFVQVSRIPFGKILSFHSVLNLNFKTPVGANERTRKVCVQFSDYLDPFSHEKKMGSSVNLCKLLIFI